MASAKEDSMTTHNTPTVPTHAARLGRLRRAAQTTVGAALVATVLAGGTPARADAVADWYGVVQSIRKRVPPASDPAVEQAGPLVALAMYDAVVAVEGGYRPYLGPLRAPPRTSAEAAAHAAAHAVLVEVFPAQRLQFDTAYADALTKLPAGTARSDGISVGEEAAGRLLSDRAVRLPATTTSFRPATEPGRFVPPQLPAREWIAALRPFVLRDVHAFRTPGPPPLASHAYARDYGEVQMVGGRDSPTRTAGQTATARFWHSTGLGQLLPQFFGRPDRTLAANARLFAVYATAEFDMAVIWVREKYRYNFWRPVTAVRNGDRDGNAATVRDEVWEPLLTTPAHPDYPCGHCLVGAMTATILAAEFGPAPPGGFVVASEASSPMEGGTRRYATFDELAAEVANSRIWGGVHFRSGAMDGAELGRRIADAIAATAFTRIVPVHARAS
jgi:PAP2 superfamily